MHFAILDSPRVRTCAGRLLVVGALLAGGAGAATAQDPSALPGDTVERNVGVLQPGDQLKIVVYRNQELSGEFPIDSRGDLQVPGLGGVIHVAGLTPAAVTEKLRQAVLQRGYADPDIAVQPLIRVSVLGEVRSPGLQLVDPGTNLLQLLTLVGGPLPTARISKTRVIRDAKVYEVDLESALQGSASGRVVLFSNDVVVVPKRTGLTRETLLLLLSGTTAVFTLINLLRSS